MPSGELRQRPGKEIIDNDVWIDWNITILSGVTIGDSTIIGAGSLVPPYTIWGGNTAIFLE